MSVLGGLFGSPETTIYNAALGQLKQISSWSTQQQIFIANCIVAQTKHETANYTSNVYKKYNNVGGYMLFPSSPYQVKGQQGSTVKDGTYAVYANITDSAKEVADWVKRRSSTFASVKTTDGYVEVLKAFGYFSTPIGEYKAGVSKYYKVISSGIAGIPTPVVVGIGVALAVGYMLSR